MTALDHQVRARGWQLALLIRIAPVAPFGIVSYALGLTAITLPQFLIGLLGSVPGLLFFVYSGALSGEVLTAFTPGQPQVDLLRLLLLGVGLLAMAATIFLVTRIIRGALAEQGESALETLDPRPQDHCH